VTPRRILAALLAMVLAGGAMSLAGGPAAVGAAEPVAAQAATDPAEGRTIAVAMAPAGPGDGGAHVLPHDLGLAPAGGVDAPPVLDRPMWLRSPVRPWRSAAGAEIRRPPRA
jgi:hypothetical protein